MQRVPHADQKQRLAALLRQLRVNAGLHQADLAERLGKPQSFVSRYEAGERRLDLIELREVCRALGTTLTEFVRKFDQAP